MTILTDTAALIAVLGTAVIYGTDIFCALVLRPAATGASDASVADLLGRVHAYGDRRLPVPGVLAIVATALAAATDDSTPGRTGGGIALAALLLWLAIYLRVSAPINKRLRAAAASHTVPADTRQLQERWDSVIWPRALLQTIALTGLLTLLIS
ncbi:anthrone oxygenase family protein [Streptomyces sp. NPDC001185]|uniref:anthrone oxygenase family protein n=1 Tax=Streptomyces sp. NPDC001185 TaxID=3154380 RepID=UPI00331BD672